MSVELLYFANPMCSWCWGFAPVMRELGERFQGRVNVTVATGSLGERQSRPMREKDKEEIRRHWQHVAEMAGQPFDMAFFEREGFVYDTAPACRALAVVRRHYPTLALPFLTRLQERFYARNEDVTDRTVLQSAVGEFGIDAQDFTREFAAPELAQEVAREWQTTAELGVTGYPTLLALADRKPHVLTVGWRPAGEIAAPLEALLRTA
ncbi:DsbA family protein [Geminicoccaceae bacterium 1502E]|nr:DsbA family protein [Geminicoccaceae bacterium 1502E]